MTEHLTCCAGRKDGEKKYLIANGRSNYGTTHPFYYRDPYSQHKSNLSDYSNYFDMQSRGLDQNNLLLIFFMYFFCKGREREEKKKRKKEKNSKYENPKRVLD